MSKRARCFYCGTGLSQKHRIPIEERLLLAIFNKASIVCKSCAKKIGAKIDEENKNYQKNASVSLSS